ncbi:MAG: hypothetical protein HDR44_03680 [Allobaculum sp.]|nr:hypothetical protein [Allobaculum sp.]
MRFHKMMVGLAMMGLSQALVGCSIASGKELKVITQKTVELGNPVSLNPADYLLDVPSKEVLEDIQVDSPLKKEPNKYTYNDFSQIVTSYGEDYLALGTYSLTLDYKGEKYPITLEVEDTVMPEFVSPAAVVTIPLGTTNFDFSDVYKTKDKDKVTLYVEGEYDLNTVGIYPVTLVAEDGSGNSNTLEISINVLGNNRQIKASDQFDYEYVPKEDTTNSLSLASSSLENETPIASNPTDSSSTGPIACSVSRLPQGSEAYYSFSQLYYEGSAWNKISPNNYFYYIESTDDCGNKVYALTKGTSDKVPSFSDSQEPAQEPIPTTPTIIPASPSLPDNEDPIPSEDPDNGNGEEGNDTQPPLEDDTPIPNTDTPTMDVKDNLTNASDISVQPKSSTSDASKESPTLQEESKP